MRNLKKILALVLALVMSLSLMAVASADDELNLGDVSDVYAESVDVLTGLKVFMGNKGEFLPKDNITRAEVAAIIYRIVTGDVTNSQNGIYADYNKFSDVTSDAWYAGYVNYCANAEYVKGVGYDANGKAMFKPQQNVTGYEALAMILRAIGYDRNNEFTGPSWQIQTAATARNRGILKNIAEGTLGGAATREAVAEILCQTILVPVADYSLAFGYRTTDANGKDNETLAYKTFKMEKIDGVVVANEYANLETQTTLGAEQTKLVTSVGDYTLNVASTLDDIGESRYVYVKPATGSTRYDLVCSKVYETDGMNKTYEVTEKVDIKDAKFNTVTGMTKDAATEEYINFGPSTNWKSDWRIRYVVSLNAVKSSLGTTITSANDTTSINRAIAELHGKFNLPTYPSNNATTIKGVTTVSLGSGAAYILTWDDETNPSYVKTITYSQEFAIKDDITPYHQGNINQIFNVADRTSLNYTSTGGYVINSDGYLVGEVYVGTTSLEDASDKMSLEQFKTTYIVADDEDIVNGNEYGNWLKVIDNDNDNVADYVLKVVYTFAQVTAVDSNGKATLSTKDQSLTDGDSVNNLTTQTVVCADELAVGNVVYYAVIDDKAQTYVPEMVTTKFDKVDRNAKTATAVENDTTYNEGGVHNHTGNPDIEAGVANLSGTYTYDVYLTRGGHLGVFTHNPTSTFTLLTNGWYDQRRGGVEYGVLAYIDGKQVDTDVTLGGGLFIGSDGVLNNNWNAIKALGNSADGKLDAEGKLNYRADAAHGKTLNDDDVRTAVAYLSADGSLIPVDRVYNNANGRTIRTIALDRIPNSNIAYYGNAYYTDIAARTAYDKPDPTDNVTGQNGVELRALSNTVYYYVYPAGNTTDNGRTNYIVDTYVGYANAPSVDRNVVEDIYAVATQTRRTVGNVVANSAYYTANVVVVELSDSYQKKGEQIFIYDMPEVHNAVGTETIKYIDSNGADTTCEIDLNDSNVRRYLSAYGKITPGLYFKYPTTRDGIFTLEKMGAADIAANNYAVGQSITENAIGWNDWVQIQPWADGTWTSNTAHYNLGGSATSSKIYSLSYSSANNSTPFQVNYSATLTACAENGFLNNFLGEYESKTGFDVTKGIVEHGPWGVKNDATHNWAADGSGNCKGTVTTNVDTVMNHNDLLIHYGSGNKIIYAISFANFDASRTSTTPIISGTTVAVGQNFAQDVWQSLVPSTVQIDKASSFFGVEETNALNSVTPGSGNTIELAYNTAYGRNANSQIFLTANASNEIVSVKVVSATNGGNDVKAYLDANTTKNAWGEYTIKVPAVADGLGAKYVVDVVDKSNTNTRYTFVVRPQVTAFGNLSLKNPITGTTITDALFSQTDKSVSIFVSDPTRVGLNVLADNLSTNKVPAAKVTMVAKRNVTNEVLYDNTGTTVIDKGETLAQAGSIVLTIDNLDGQKVENVVLTVNTLTGTLYSVTLPAEGVATATCTHSGVTWTIQSGDMVPDTAVITITLKPGYQATNLTKTVASANVLATDFNVTIIPGSATQVEDQMNDLLDSYRASGNYTDAQIAAKKAILDKAIEMLGKEGVSPAAVKRSATIEMADDVTANASTVTAAAGEGAALMSGNTVRLDSVSGDGSTSGSRVTFYVQRGTSNVVEFTDDAVLTTEQEYALASWWNSDGKRAVFAKGSVPAEAFMGAVDENGDAILETSDFEYATFNTVANGGLGEWKFYGTVNSYGHETILDEIFADANYTVGETYAIVVLDFNSLATTGTDNYVTKRILSGAADTGTFTNGTDTIYYAVDWDGWASLG